MAASPTYVHNPQRAPNALLDEKLFRPLTALRYRARLYQTFNGFLRLFVTLILTGLLQLGLDYWLRFTLDQRAALNVAITIVWLIIIVRYLVRPLLRPLPDRLLAGWVDRAHPALRDHLTTAVELSTERTNDSPQLVAAVLQEAAAAAERISFLDVLDHRRSATRAAGFFAAALAIATAWLTYPNTMNTWFERNWLLHDVPWKQDTHIVPLDFDPHTGRRRIPRGEEVVVRAHVVGKTPRSATLFWQADDDRRGRETMTLIGRERLEAGLGPLTEDLRFRIVGGDERTREYVIEAVDAPQVLRMVARLRPPAYVQLDAIDLEQQTFIEILEGSSVELIATVNKLLRSAELVGQGGPAARGEMNGREVRIEWPHPVSGNFRLELEDRDGWRDRNPVRLTFKIVPDRPPSVQMRLVGASDIVTPEANLVFAVEFEDTYGLATAGVRVQKGEEPLVAIEVPGFQPPERRVQTDVTWPVDAIRAVPGERLRLWAEAADLDPRGPNVGRSSPSELRIVTVEEFQAEMARRELELRRDFEQLLSGQRGLEGNLRRLTTELPQTGGAPTPAQLQRLNGLARQQAAHGARALNVAERFTQILAEMRTSRVARAAIERRIQDRIIAPTTALARELVPAAATAISALRNAPTAEGQAAALGAQAKLLGAMNSILTNFLEWEGYREAIALLEEIIAEQGAIHEATKKQLERQLESILGLDEPESEAPASQPAIEP